MLFTHLMLILKKNLHKLKNVKDSRKAHLKFHSTDFQTFMYGRVCGPDPRHHDLSVYLITS